MKYLKIKKIFMQEDQRNSNILERDDNGKPTKFKQSQYTCRFLLEDQDGNEYAWVAENSSLSEAIEKIAQNEEVKYKINEKEIKEFPSGKFLLGRNLFFLSWIYPLYDWYLQKFGFNPPKEHLQKAEKNKNGKY